MAVFKICKVVSALPAQLVASTIYLVKTGGGFDIYATNDQGTIVAYPINAPASTPKVTVGTTAPIDPSVNDLWIDTN